VAVATDYGRRLAARLGPPGDDGATKLLFGAWRLAVGAAR